MYLEKDKGLQGVMGYSENNKKILTYEQTKIIDSIVLIFSLGR